MNTMPRRWFRVPMLRSHLAVLSLGATALLAAGCATTQSAHGATTTLVPPSSASTAPLSTASASASGTPSGTTVTATETEFRIALSEQSFTPGKYTFQAVNAGTTIHNLAITGPGASAVTKGLSPGAKADLTVTLHAGTYDIFCAIAGHKQLGMNVNITVS